MKRIFVVGAPRSGTTLLQSMLASHPKLTSFTESHFFHKNFYKYKCIYLPKPYIKKNLINFLLENQFSSNDIQIVENFNHSYSSKIWTRRFIDLLDNYSNSLGLDGWIEKTPVHLQHIKYISKNVNDSFFIHIVRDGKDVISSIYEISNNHPEIWGRRSLIECINRWNRDVQLSLNYLNRPNHIIIKYEELITQPKLILNFICDLLDINWDENMLNYQHSTSNLIREHEKWKSGNKNKLTKNTRFNNLNTIDKTYLIKNMDQEIYNKIPSLTNN